MASIYLAARRDTKRAVEMIIDRMNTRKVKYLLLPGLIGERLRTRYSVSLALGELEMDDRKPEWSERDRDDKTQQ